MTHDFGVRHLSRPVKPRVSGITQVLDRGLDLQRLTGILQDHSSHIDMIKFGWGSALVTSTIYAKIEACRNHSIKPLLGGTLFEYCYLTNQYAPFIALLDELQLDCVEISNGANAIEQSTICKLVRELAKERFVCLEVGCKSLIHSETMTLETWTSQIEAALEAGANLVVLEARESGRAGYCESNGQAKEAFCQVFLERFGTDRLMFEAPTRDLQTTLINTYGSQLNLANISYDDVVSLETIRLGLRFDSMFIHGIPSQLSTRDL
ncbi:MAG: phosphosulfolactate synthase [Cyanobacteriota bacterium]|jgi:phosphosulfolactate synthase